jgi:CxxC-x17-CxxC domain-containing protein
MDDNDIVLFAETNFRNQNNKFGIKRDDRRRHTYMIGKTGMGKTTLLENMIISDIINGDGCCYVDPHGDTAEKILDFIPPNRINDVIYFNPADTDFPIAFNVLEATDEKSKHLVASGLVGIFKKQFAESWGPRLEYILRNTILALLDTPGTTMLGIMRILVDKDYRDKIVAKIKDPVVKSFWLNEFTKWNERNLQEVVSPIQNKVGQFMSNFLIRNIVGQVKSTFDLRDVIDNQKILIMNLSKGRIGEDTMQLLGSSMVTKLYLAAMSRVDIPEEDRKDFYLYVDEFQNFATDSFADILSEARKYRLNLVMAHQFIEQLPENVSAAVFGNVGTLISFRVGAADADTLVKEFAPIFTEEDLVNLPAFNIYLKLMIDGVTSDPFSANTLPPLFEERKTDNRDKVLKVSRERYANDRESTEDRINRWSGMDLEEKPVVNLIHKPDYKPDEGEKKEKPKSTKSLTKEAKALKYESKPKTKEEKYIVECFECGKSTEINFFPDGKRPVFCKDCLNKSRKDRQKKFEEPSGDKSDINKKPDIDKVPAVGDAKIKEPGDAINSLSSALSEKSIKSDEQSDFNTNFGESKKDSSIGSLKEALDNEPVSFSGKPKSSHDH